MKIRTSTIDTSKLSKVLFLIISIVIGIATALNYEITIGFILILILFLLFIKKPEIPLSIQFIGTIIYFYLVFKLGMKTTTYIMTGSFHVFLVYSYILGGFLFNIEYPRKLKVSLIDLLFIIFFFIIFLSYLIFSKNSIKMQYAPVFVIAPYLGVQLLQSAKRINLFIKYCIIVVIIQMIFSFYELIFNPIFKESTRFSMYELSTPGRGDNPILYAITFAVLIIILLSKLYEHEEKSKLLYFFLLIPSSYLLLRAGSRGVLFSIFIAIFLYLFFIIKLDLRKKICSILFIILLFIAILGLLPESTRNFYFYVIESSHIPGTSMYIRINMIEDSFNDIKRSPIWGIGTGNSASGYGAPHNLLLEVLVEWGIIGMFVFLLLCYITIKTALIFIRTEKRIDLVFLMKLSLFLFVFFLIRGILFGGYITTYTQFFISMALISVIGKLRGKPICLLRRENKVMKRIKQKILLLTNIISPYRISLFNIISKEKNFNFKILVLAEREKNREWEFDKAKIKSDYQILSGYHWFKWNKGREIAIHLNREVFKILLKNKPDIVITSGYDSLAYWQAFLYCKIFKKKFILWNGTTLLSAAGVKGLRGLLKGIIIKGSGRYIAYGTKAKEYLEYFGAKSDNIYISTNTVDVECFQRKVMKYRNSDSFIRERKKYPKYLLLYIGQLIRRKGIIQILKVLNNLSDSEVGLMIVGSGPEENVLKEFCKEKNIKNVFFEGFCQQDELVKYYALADIFILSSFEEVWGLVVNEALASGMYVLSSKYAGASYDLIKEGWNGEIFDPNNVEEIVNLIKKVKENIKDIRKRRDDISKHAYRAFSIENSARDFIKAFSVDLK